MIPKEQRRTGLQAVPFLFVCAREKTVAKDDERGYNIIGRNLVGLFKFI